MPRNQDQSEIPRREFLSWSLTGLTGWLAGCVQHPDPASPAVVKAKRGTWIDVHAHIFNAEDLDTYGYLEHGEGDSRARKIAFGALFPILKLVCETARQIAPGIERENWLLDKMLEARASRKRKGQGHPKDALVLSKLLLEDLRTADQSKHEEITQAGQAFKEKLLHCPNELTDGDKKPHVLRELMARLARNIKPSFFTCLANYRIYNALSLIANYPQVDAFVVASLDVDSWYLFHGRRAQPGAKMLLQAEIMAKIAVLTEGRIIPRTGFCPLRQMLSTYLPRTPDAEPSPLEVLECSIQQFGAIGAKLYPVVGYRPIGNGLMTNRELADLPMVDIARALQNRPEWAAAAAKLQDDEHTIGTQIDDALRQLYRACLHSDTSIMAHTNRSWGPAPFMNRIAPNWWQQVAEDYPNLRVNLAHFGGFTNGRAAYGDMGQTAPGGRTGWPDEICQQLFRKEYPHFHADVADISSSEPLAKDLIGIYRDYPMATGRLMYGSDWHEALFPTGAPKYFRGWTDLFARHPELAARSMDFFGGNAVRFHSLAGGKTRTRLNDFYKAHGVEPTWAAQVDHDAKGRGLAV